MSELKLSNPLNPKDRAASTRLDVSLFPQTAIIYGAWGMTEGDYKYAAYNFREVGVRTTVYYSACMRHMMKFYNGEWCDQKTKVPHLASALSCIAILIDGFEMNNINDDRPPSCEIADLLERVEGGIKHLQTLFPNPPERVTALSLKNK